MKTKTIELYEFNELSDEAKEKARSDWAGINDHPFLTEYLNERLGVLLEKNGISGEGKVMYSLGYSQGDGVMFEGRFNWDGYDIVISHSGNYYHHNSKEIEFVGERELENSEDEEKIDRLYIDICKQVEREAYREMENDNSMQSFSEMCESNEWTFTKEGKFETE